MICNVRIEALPLKEMRYRTVGDWFMTPDGCLVIQVVDTQNWKYNLLIAIHELVEAVLCEEKGISEPDNVLPFDLAHQHDEDPGMHPNAPYHSQHLASTGIEMILAALLGVKWRTYEQALDRIYYKIPKRKKPL